MKIDKIISLEESKTKAFASVTIGGAVVVHGVRIMNSAKGLFVAMPANVYVDDNGENKEAIEKSKLIHEKTKASYPFLMPDKTNFNGRLNGIQAMPETFFVDSNGNIVGDTYSGAKSAKEWKQVIEKELKKIKNK